MVDQRVVPLLAASLGDADTGEWLVVVGACLLARAEGVLRVMQVEF